MGQFVSTNYCTTSIRYVKQNLLSWSSSPLPPLSASLFAALRSRSPTRTAAKVTRPESEESAVTVTEVKIGCRRDL